MISVFDLCIETFSKIPAQWKERLLALEEHYTPDELTSAFARGKQHGAKDLKYIEAILTNLRKEQSPVIEDGVDWDAEVERWKRSPHVHILSGNEDDDGPAPDVPEDESRRYATSALRWWLAQPSCYLSEQNEAIARDELRRREGHVAFVQSELKRIAEGRPWQPSPALLAMRKLGRQPDG